MKITFHDHGNTAVWEEDTALITGTKYMIERLMDVWEHHKGPVKLTETGPEAYPELLTADGATACGLVAGFAMTDDDPNRHELPEGAIP